jgi:ferredoxin
MEVEIYYFSGTGNSLFVAREIAGRLGGKLIPIFSMINKESISTDAVAIGIVFPVYYATNDCGIPLIIGRFIRKLENLGSKYVFAVCTCGNMSGATIANIAKLVKFQGGELAAGFTFKMNNKTLTHAKQEKALAYQKEKLNAVCEYVSARKKGRLETRGIMSKIVLSPLLYLAIKPAFSRRYRKLSVSSRMPFRALIPLADKSFQVDAKCIGCGTCAKVCPVENIKIENNKPVWQHHCETCLACYAWCPQEAITGEIVSYNERYHNPSIKLSQMLKEK